MPVLFRLCFCNAQHKSPHNDTEASVTFKDIVILCSNMFRSVVPYFSYWTITPNVHFIYGKEVKSQELTPREELQEWESWSNEIEPRT